MRKIQVDLPTELVSYLTRRAGRGALSIETVLEEIIRESMRYDALVAAMGTRDEIQPIQVR